MQRATAYSDYLFARGKKYEPNVDKDSDETDMTHEVTIIQMGSPEDTMLLYYLYCRGSTEYRRGELGMSICGVFRWVGGVTHYQYCITNQCNSYRSTGVTLSLHTLSRPGDYDISWGDEVDKSLPTTLQTDDV
ncbi:hypothetical protein Btru_061763 [Bulinus truncatus]|nr:hypothetical protein Btru_061763 [Bulinus truncatus]